MNNLLWKKYFPLSDQNAFICLADKMGDDATIVERARTSYGKDVQDPYKYPVQGQFLSPEDENHNRELDKRDRQLIRYLMNHQHTSPFEMVEFVFLVQVPMDCWRQWVRHRTASINEYSTRYTEAIDCFQVTSPQEWRLQATDNKQGSSGYLTEWPEGYELNEDRFMIYTPDGGFKSYGYGGPSFPKSPGEYLTVEEERMQKQLSSMYKERLAFGIAKEQARKDLPLSTYTRAYWKCDLHNIFNFLRLRMDSHAQLEIRSFANCMFEIVKQVCPVACEAFEDYVLHARRFSRMEMEVLKAFLRSKDCTYLNIHEHKPNSTIMADREWKEFLNKLS